MIKNNDKQVLEKLLNKGSSDPFTTLHEALILKPNFSRDSVFTYLSKFTHKFGGIGYLSNEITDLLVGFGELYKPNNVLDPACGACQILSKVNYCNNLKGIEQNSKLAELAKILNPNVNIDTGDYLSSDNNEKFDQIILNPPFGVRMQISNKQEASEGLFIQKSLDSLNYNGVLIAIVPNTFLFSQRFEVLRKLILKNNYLEAVIELKSGSIKNTGLLTSILVIKKDNPTHKAKVYFGQYQNDWHIVVKNFQEQAGEFWVDRSRLENRMDRSFFNPQFDELDKQLSGISIKRLEEIAEIIRGPYIKREELDTSGSFLIMSGKNIKNGKFIKTTTDKYLNELSSRQEKSLLRKGDIVISLIFSENKIYIHNSEEKIVANNNCAIIRATNLGPYLSSYISSVQGNLLIKRQMDRKRHGAVIPSININDLRQLIIPIVSIEDPNRIVDQDIPVNERYALIESLLEDQLVKKGWDVRGKSGPPHITLDLGLYVNGELASFVEVKSPGVNLERVGKQVSYVMNEVGVTTAFVVRGNNLYSFSLGNFIEIDEFPTVTEFNNITQNKVSSGGKHNESISNLEKMVNQLLSQNKELIERTRRIETTVNEIKDILVSLQNDFEEIKKEDRDEEEKLVLLYKKIDRRLNEKNEELKEEIDAYTDIAKSLITNWNKLEPLSKEYYPLAEYLFSKLQSMPNIDFSPVILQYCRTIENELLNKLFIKFTRYLINKCNPIEDFLTNDLAKDEKGRDKPTKQFANTIIQCRNKNDNEIKYTLGTMHFILNYASTQNHRETSFLISEFIDYIENNFDSNIVLSTNYLKEISSIINDFRNKCAHPSKLNLNEAIECKRRMPSDINTFIDCQK
jgi:predicted RNA methylase